MLGNLANQVRPIKIADAVAAGVDAAVVDSAAIDCSGFDRLLVVLRVGATAVENGVVALSVVDCDTSGGTYAAITGAAISHINGGSGETNQFYLLDTKLVKKYAKVRYQRTVQNTAFIAATAYLYNSKKVPVAVASDIQELTIN